MNLLLFQLQHDEIIESVLHLDDLVLECIKSVLLPFNLEMVLFFRAISSLFGRLVHFLFESFHFIKSRTVLTELLSIRYESVSLLASRVILESSYD